MNSDSSHLLKLRLAVARFGEMDGEEDFFSLKC